jgi:hypothetical protein
MNENDSNQLGLLERAGFDHWKKRDILIMAHILLI